MTKPNVIWLAAGVLLLSACAWGQNRAVQGVPNLAQVEPGLWRGGQPTDRGWIELRSMGITNVIKLNLESEGSDLPGERLGMRVYPVPLTLAQQIGARKISAESLEKVLTHVPANGTFVHCEHGQDRTGVFVAIWRVQIDGWSKADAEKEMLAHGFHKNLKGLWRFWNDFQIPNKIPARSPDAP